MREIRMKRVFRAPYVFRGSIVPRLTGNQLGAAPEGYLSGTRSDEAGTSCNRELVGKTDLKNLSLQPILAHYAKQIIDVCQIRPGKEHFGLSL